MLKAISYAALFATLISGALVAPGCGDDNGDDQVPTEEPNPPSDDGDDDGGGGGDQQAWRRVRWTYDDEIGITTLCTRPMSFSVEEDGDFSSFPCRYAGTPRESRRGDLTQDELRRLDNAVEDVLKAGFRRQPECVRSSGGAEETIRVTEDDGDVRLVLRSRFVDDNNDRDGHGNGEPSSQLETCYFTDREVARDLYCTMRRLVADNYPRVEGGAPPTLPPECR